MNLKKTRVVPGVLTRKLEGPLPCPHPIGQTNTVPREDSTCLYWNGACNYNCGNKESTFITLFSGQYRGQRKEKKKEKICLLNSSNSFQLNDEILDDTRRPPANKGD
ncbi:MAG: hypothetical protein ACTSUE_04785 [Promethearchaeota archaeon]